jgi:hypothetical protein
LPSLLLLLLPLPFLDNFPKGNCHSEPKRGTCISPVLAFAFAFALAFALAFAFALALAFTFPLAFLRQFPKGEIVIPSPSEEPAFHPFLPSPVPPCLSPEEPAFALERPASSEQPPFALLNLSSHV